MLIETYNSNNHCINQGMNKSLKSIQAQWTKKFPVFTFPHLLVTYRHGSQYGNQKTNASKECLDSSLIQAFIHSQMFNWSVSLMFWNGFWLEIIIYYDIFYSDSQDYWGWFHLPTGSLNFYFHSPEAKCYLSWAIGPEFFSCSVNKVAFSILKIPLPQTKKRSYFVH